MKLNQKRPYFVNYIIEVFDVDKDLLITSNHLKIKINEFIKGIKIIPIKKMSHNFIPYGITISYILKSSHMTVHTWPENNYLHIHLLNCTEIGEDRIIKTLNKIFPKRKFNIQEVKYHE